MTLLQGRRQGFLVGGGGGRIVGRWPTYPQNTLKFERHRIWTILFSNLGGHPPKFFTAGTRPLRSPLSTPMYYCKYWSFLTYLATQLNMYEGYTAGRHHSISDIPYMRYQLAVWIITHISFPLAVNGDESVLIPELLCLSPEHPQKNRYQSFSIERE